MSNTTKLNCVSLALFLLAMSVMLLSGCSNRDENGNRIPPTASQAGSFLRPGGDVVIGQ